MKQGIGFSQTITIISIFIFLTFAFLSASLSYYKAFKVNNVISSSIEKYEGYNSLSVDEITFKLESLGYRLGTTKCKDRRKYLSHADHKLASYSAETSSDKMHDYCVYKYPDKDGYFTYGIVTYIYVELPFGVKIKLPVYSETDAIFNFSA